MKQKYTSLILLFVITILFFSCKTSKQDDKVIYSNTLEQDKNDVIFVRTEQSAEFSGGDKALKEYLLKNIKYPKKLRKKDIQGQVFVYFVVEKDGSLSHIKVIKGLSKDCDKEAVRVVKNMPKWQPAKQGGKPVRMQYIQPIAFQL